MPPYVRDLEFTVLAIEKLGRRGISITEARQLRENDPRFFKNPRAPRGSGRQHLVGVTNGGRKLDLVVEPMHDPGIWLVITGWDF